jgi:hypothetical protein
VNRSHLGGPVSRAALRALPGCAAPGLAQVAWTLAGLALGPQPNRRKARGFSVEEQRVTSDEIRVLRLQPVVVFLLPDTFISVSWIYRAVRRPTRRTVQSTASHNY